MTKEAVGILREELKMLEDLFDDMPKTSAQKRVLIRSMFASIEALTSAMMDVALPCIASKALGNSNSHEERHKLFFEICALSDLSYQISNSGELKLTPNKTNFKSKVLFAVKSLAKSNEIDLNPKSIEGWSSFTPSTKIRNRVTHPNSKEDLDVTQEDYEITLSALQWVVRCNHKASGGNDY